MPTDPPALIEWLGASESGPEALGGKGASLDRLIRLGYRVPRGFCVTTAAFRAGPAGAAALHEALRTALDRLTADVEAETGRPARLAVRSSALGEDGADASFAGLHETELDLAPADVPAAVRRCWVSLSSPPALAYRERRGIAVDDAAMGVVVQALVPAEASAVVFTRHPVTGRKDQLVITSALGLGDAMVSGTITPDTLVVDKATGETIEFMPGDGQGAPVLEGDVLAALVEIARKVEGDYGRAMDLEAAFAAGVWFLLQARPITTGTAAGVLP